MKKAIENPVAVAVANAKPQCIDFLSFISMPPCLIVYILSNEPVSKLPDWA
jgi:hypothetical protein